jgi:hypothetical protein
MYPGDDPNGGCGSNLGSALITNNIRGCRRNNSFSFNLLVNLKQYGYGMARCMPRCLLLAHLYGPAARCKPKMVIWGRLVLRFCIRPVDRAFKLLAIMDIRARSISFASRPRRPYGPPDHERAGETFSPSPLSDSQTSAGKPTLAFGSA